VAAAAAAAAHAVVGGAGPLAGRAGVLLARREQPEVGLNDKLRIQLTHCVKAPGFKP
jgi:hypothetical protein